MLRRHLRKEAQSRAPDYAEYYLKFHGDAASQLLAEKAERHPLFSYHRLLYRLAAKEVLRRAK